MKSRSNLAVRPGQRLWGFMALALIATAVGDGASAADPPVKRSLEELATAYVRRGVQYPQNPAVRAQAVEACQRVQARDVALLIRGALKDEHAGVRFAACMTLGHLKDADAAADVRALLKDADASVRVSVFFALERMGDASHRTQWAQTLRGHDNAAVRRNAALAMGLLEDPKVLPLLERAAANDPDDGVRLQALEGMARLGDKAAIGRFIRYSIAGESFRQPFALLALGHVKDERVGPALRARLESSPYLESRLAAARSLGMMGYKDGFQLALDSLEWNKPLPDLPDDPPASQVMRVRSMAAMALGEIGDRRALDALARRMQTPDDPRVQLAAATAILMILNGTAS